jgi:hypothetical protein
MRQPTIHQMREKKKSSRKSQGSRKVTILNLRLTNIQWRQYTLSIRFGGVGIRRISDICLPAFLSSINGAKKLVSLLLNSKDNELIIHHYDEALAVWGVENEN